MSALIFKAWAATLAWISRAVEFLKSEQSALERRAHDSRAPTLARFACQVGAVSIEGIIMIFIGIVIIYQLITQLSDDNAAVQASGNATGMAKFAAGLGEWMFPLLGIVALVFLLFKGGKKGDMV